MSDLRASRLFRWAPTPSGPLHLGNIFSFILTELFAKQAAADIQLRIDDLDVTRARPALIQDIFRVLETLGLRWQRGPKNFSEFEKHFSQALAQDFYHSEFDRYRAESPEKFFVCECTRSEIARVTQDGLYPGTCRAKNLDWKEGRVWRCRVPEGTIVSWEDRLQGTVSIDLAREMGDFVIYRREALFAYQWVSFCEDLRSGVTDIVRGNDLRTSTAAQIFLASGTVFERCSFAHHPLILAGDKKLSKSEGAAAVETILNQPSGKEAIFQAFASWCAWPEAEELRSLKDLHRVFASQRGELGFGHATQIHELF